MVGPINLAFHNATSGGVTSAGVATAAIGTLAPGASATVIVAGPGRGAGAGDGAVLNVRTGAVTFNLPPFGSQWASSISVARGDLNGDGVPDVVVGGRARRGPEREGL